MNPEAVTRSPQAEVLRTIAHELRQPLSSIEAVAFYLSLVLPDDPKIQAQLEQIRLLVEQSNRILADGLGRASQLLWERAAAESHPDEIVAAPLLAEPLGLGDATMMVSPAVPA